jgi:hypothetical protein
MVAEINPLCPPSAPFFGFMGAAVALISHWMLILWQSKAFFP